jgi:hypothetical protein
MFHILIFYRRPLLIKEFLIKDLLTHTGQVTGMLVCLSRDTQPSGRWGVGGLRPALLPIDQELNHYSCYGVYFSSSLVRGDSDFRKRQWAGVDAVLNVWLNVGGARLDSCNRRQ